FHPIFDACELLSPIIFSAPMFFNPKSHDRSRLSKKSNEENCVYVTKNIFKLSAAARGLGNGSGSERFGARAVSRVPDLHTWREHEREHGPDLLGALVRPVGRQ